ncbi:MAG TPA: PA0069 family radical SAM protein [Alphaproteobacteria bacterium]
MTDNYQPDPMRHRIRGRGAGENPAGRFEKLTPKIDEDAWIDPEDYLCEGKQIQTQVFRDATRSVITSNDSPDVGMESSVNPYRGCEHGCIYCFARPGHEYLGMSAGIDFETKIFAKPEAPALLAKEFSAKSYVPRTIMFSGNTDCYQPLERHMKITRRCMDVCADFRNPVVIVTKNQLVTRDIDIFKRMAEYHCIGIKLSITSLDGSLARVMEPRASQPKLRLRAVEALASAGIPVGIMIGPVLPGLTDHEIPAILEAAANAGAQDAHYTMLRLPYGVKDLFQTWLDDHFPDKKDKILHRLREIRGGKLNNAEFGERMRGQGFFAEQVAQMFAMHIKKFGLNKKRMALTTDYFNRDAYNAQMSLF